VVPDLATIQARKVAWLMISQAWAQFYINKSIMSMKNKREFWPFLKPREFRQIVEKNKQTFITIANGKRP